LQSERKEETMKRSRFTEEQVIAALKQHAAGTPAKERCRRLGVGVETLAPPTGLEPVHPAPEAGALSD
jgi:hypothetical protein